MSYTKALKEHLNLPKFNLPNFCKVGVVAIWLLNLTGAKAQTPLVWHKVKEANNIKVFTANAPNYPVKGIRTEVIFDAPIEQVIAVAMDISNYPNWIYHCYKTEIVKQPSAQEIIYYHVTDAPWPVDDRDQYSITKLTKQPDGSYWMNSHTLANYGAEVKGNVRVKNGKAIWHFTPLPNGKTKGEYELFFDPEGYIPGWMINLFIAEGPYVTMLNMQGEIKKLAKH